MHFLKRIIHFYRQQRIIAKTKSIFGTSIQEIIGKKIESSEYVPSKTDLALIILNRNNSSVIFKCVDQLLLHNTYGYQIIVVDNDSSDGSFQKLQAEYSNNITLLKNSKNGCSSGRNLGARNTKAKLLLFLDSDQWPISDNWLDHFLHIHESEKEIGAIGWAAGFITESDMTGPTVDHYPERGLPDGYLYRTNIDYLGSGGLLVSHALFDDLKGFDEAYDPYSFEDTDFSRKILASGKKIAYSKHLKIKHQAHSTTGTNQLAQSYLAQLQKNAAQFRRKWQSDFI